MIGSYLRGLGMGVILREDQGRVGLSVGKKERVGLGIGARSGPKYGFEYG